MNIFCDAIAGIGLETTTCNQFAIAQNSLLTSFALHTQKYALTFENSEEYKLRLEMFAKNEMIINEHNTASRSFKLGHNKFSTWTDKEYREILGNKPETDDDGTFTVFPETDEAEVDWRTKNAVNPIKDQGHCQSCWAFSAVAAMEGAHAIKSGELISMSEQQVVSCTGFPMGCHGGGLYDADEYILKFPLETEADYPYTSTSPQTTGDCLTDKDKEFYSLVKYDKVGKKDPTQLKAAIAQ